MEKIKDLLHSLKVFVKSDDFKFGAKVLPLCFLIAIMFGAVFIGLVVIALNIFIHY